MADVDAVREALRWLMRALAEERIDEPMYQRRRRLLAADLTQEERSAIGITPAPDGSRLQPHWEADTMFVDLPAGSLLCGRYRVGERIGAGSLGVV